MVRADLDGRLGVPSEVVTDSGKEYTSDGGENYVLALESTTSDVKSTRIERCLAKEPAAHL